MSVAQIQESTSSNQADADAELAVAASMGAASRALRAGARAPAFTLADASGRKVVLEELLHAGPVVLHFVRGPWCSFGEESLAEFATVYQKVVELGASAVAIAPFASPFKAPSASVPMSMRELQDIDMKVGRAYGLAFDLPAGLRPRYEALGYVPPPTGRAGTWLVPLPATYLVDRDGIIALAFIDVDYRRHVEPGSLLTALRALHARHESPRRAARL
ncbi:peroxiredoxin-like family protein [Burkholderia sp. S171]|uniref:peroxiredoxin-like family protein n=1 Tax=Burkholderia sp. S171 TaxID=1641860 RepID=UPI00131B1ADE|nr:peroxiredoxin-like family protein [Burkholderia sp. S171]